MRWLKGLLGGGADELGWDDLIARVVDELARHAHFGARGEVTFASALRVELAVPSASAEVVRRFTADPRFDREVGAALANRCDAPAAALPLRAYAVTEAPAGEGGGEGGLRVLAVEQAPPAWQLEISGGDRDGQTLPVPGGAGELVFGRGEGGGVDLPICERTAFVSRRAGALHRSGAQLEVAALDQGDHLQVRRGDGEVVRPARTARGRVALREGDSVELGDGRGALVRLALRRRGEGAP
jgi:hypothetical protein